MNGLFSGCESDLERVDRLLRRRRSVRAFPPDPVPRATTQAMLATAGRAPSWCSTQPWNVVITAGEGTTRFREALVEQARADHRARVRFPFPIRGTLSGVTTGCSGPSISEPGNRARRP